MELPGWYVTAGCLFQTVWNVVTGRPPTSGIKDYDIFYFDCTGLSWEAEDAVIKAGQEVFAGLSAEVEIRNEATEAAIDSFAATTCCLGVRQAGGQARAVVRGQAAADGCLAGCGARSVGEPKDEPGEGLVGQRVEAARQGAHAVFTPLPLLASVTRCGYWP